MAAVILDFVAYSEKKKAEKELAQNKKLYEIIAKNIAHLTHRNPKEGSDEESQKHPGR